MKQFKEINGITICYDDTMEMDKKPLFLFHGLTGNKETMYMFRDIFKDQYRTICVDTRGHGESTHPEVYTLRDHGLDAHALIEALGFEKVNILGYSMGSYVALQIAEIKSDNIDRLILLCTKPSGKTSSVEKLAKERGIDMKSLTPQQLQQIILSSAYAPKTLEKMKTGEFDPSTINAGINGVQLTPEEKEAESKSLANFDLTNDLDKVNCKTLVISGEFDGINGPELGEIVAKGIKGSKYVMIKDAGHMVPYEQPEEFIKVVREFLSE